ncbi:MAG: ABC transporter permease subunit [Polyangiales bacterium]
MLTRILALVLNTFREAARDRVPLALFGCGFAVGIASLLVAAMSLGRDSAEVVAVLTSSALSLFAIIGAIVLGASLLYKDLERKTIFPILARPVRRHELVIGKHLGVVATVAVFALLDGALALTLTAMSREERLVARAFAGWVVVGIAAVVILLRARDKSTPLLVLAPAIVITQAMLVGPLGDLRALIMVTVFLAVVEAAIVAAVSLVFGAFSTPFLTAVLTVGLVLVGRNADLLAKLPEKTFGPQLRRVGYALSRVVPNLHVYVPPRVVATGRVGSLSSYLAEAAAYGALYVVFLLAASSLFFRRRDFT